jgi:Cu/Ag efflux pump CusA
MATEKELRTEIRKHVQKMLKEYQPGGFLQSVGSQARASLGQGKNMIDKYLGDIDSEKLAGLPKMQKVSLLASLMKTFGISAEDLTSMKGQVTNKLKKFSAMEPVDEGKLNEEDNDLGTRKAGLTAKDLGGQSQINRAEEFIASIKKMPDEKDKIKAIGYLLANIGMSPMDLQQNLSGIKTAIRQQATGVKK